MLLSQNDILDALRAQLGHDEITDLHFSINDVDTLNFHSYIHLVRVTARVNLKLEEFTFFLKSVDVDGEIFKRFLGPTKMFEKECYVLTHVIPYIQTATTRKITAECYLVQPLKFILLENLTTKGFKSLGKFIDMEHARAAIEALANLHAASLIKEEEDGVNLGEKFKDYLYETLIVWKKPPEESLIYSMDARLREMGRQFFSHLTPEFQRRVFDGMLHALLNLCRPSERFRNVITQGDAWGGNLLFNYDENGKPREALLVDFQVLRYAPPAQELQSFLHLASPHSRFISDHSDELKRMYYESLGERLSDRGLDIASFLPGKEFHDSCEVYREFAVAARVYYAANTRLPPKYLADLTASQKVYADFMVGCCFDIGLDAYRNDAQYKKEIDESMEEAFKFYGY